MIRRQGPRKGNGPGCGVESVQKSGGVSLAGLMGDYEA